MCSDEYVKDRSFVSKEDIRDRAQVVIIGVPHRAYAGLRLPRSVEVVDVWGILGRRA
jgi:UDP-N-acetyl-D-mannosaminuronic acid dehydrogenase